MFHVGAVNYLADYLGQVQRKQRVLSPSEKVLVDKKNATVPGVVLSNGIAFALPNYLAFRFILKDYPIYRMRHFVTAGMFFLGVGSGVKQAGSKFLLDFCSLPDSDAASEAREIVRRENPQHPFLLAVEAKMRQNPTSLSSSFEGGGGGDDAAWKPREEVVPKPQINSDNFAASPPPLPPSPLRYGSKSVPYAPSHSAGAGQQQRHNSREFVGEDAFASEPPPPPSSFAPSAGGGNNGWDQAAATGSHPPPPPTRTWEDVQREFDQKKRGL
ncbi:hypothetical protein BASA81_003624 [Batrachochytrium salamandrivorans]|nr:hypothetical protein BASA81_003624 [Batrachochytrium salamandrivorans]